MTLLRRMIFFKEINEPQKIQKEHKRRVFKALNSQKCNSDKEGPFVLFVHFEHFVVYFFK